MFWRSNSKVLFSLTLEYPGNEDNGWSSFPFLFFVVLNKLLACGWKLSWCFVHDAIFSLDIVFSTIVECSHYENSVLVDPRGILFDLSKIVTCCEIGFVESLIIVGFFLLLNRSFHLLAYLRSLDFHCPFLFTKGRNCVGFYLTIESRELFRCRDNTDLVKYGSINFWKPLVI